jgi:hypothetical protein
MNNVHDSPPQSDHCVWCLTPTGLHTAIGSDALWIVRFLLRLGLPEDQAEATAYGRPDGPVPEGRVIRTFPICDACARRTGLRTALAIDGWDDVPVVHQPEGDGS